MAIQYLNFTRETKISDLEELVFCNEHVATGQVTMDNLQTGQIFLERERERG